MKDIFKATISSRVEWWFIVSVLILAQILSATFGCDKPQSTSPASAPQAATELPRLVHQSGRELMEVSPPQEEERSIQTAKEVPLPGVLEAIGQVTFDDRLVSTIISRVSGRIEELRKSQ